jgi:hypothetical protein
MTKTLPTSTGYYWWVQKFDGEITAKCVLQVEKHKGYFYAHDEEYNFIINKVSLPDEEFWQKIEEPPNP